MLDETYTLDTTTLLTLMAVCFVMGFMFGKKFMQFKMMILFVIVFVIGSLNYLK